MEFKLSMFAWGCLGAFSAEFLKAFFLRDSPNFINNRRLKFRILLILFIILGGVLAGIVGFEEPIIAMLLGAIVPLIFRILAALCGKEI